MANNEIKVKITADNKQFLKAIDEVTGAVKKLNSLKTTDIDIVLSKADTVMRQIGEIGKALLGIADRTVKVNVNASQALGEISKVQESMNRLPDKTVKITADAAQAISGINRVKEEIKGVQGIEVKLVGNPSGMLASLMDRVRNAEVVLNVNFSGATASAREFRSVLDGIKNTLAQVLSGINAIGSRRVRIRIDVDMPAIDTSMIGQDLFRNATASADAFIAKLRSVNELLEVAVRTAARIQVPTMPPVPAIVPVPSPTPSVASGGGGGGSSGGGGFFDGFLGSIAKVGAAIAGVTYALGQVKDVAASVVMPGFNYVKEMETSQLGIAGILTSMTNLNGKAMDFGSAMDISSDIMKKLQRDAILTSATTGEMVTTFRALLAPGIGAGMNIEEIREFTKVGVNAVKAMGLNSTQFVQELRDLVQGGIQPASSTLATSLGLTDADIKKAKASTEGLYKFLMDRMAGFAPMAERFPNTFAGKMSMLSESFTLASAKLTQAFEPEIKNVLDMLLGMIGTFNKETGNLDLSPALQGSIDKIISGVEIAKNLIKELAEQFGAFDTDGTFYMSTETLDLLNQAKETLDDIGVLLTDIGGAGNSFVPILIEIVTRVLEWVDAFIEIADVIVNVVGSAFGDMGGHLDKTKTLIDLAVDALFGFFIMSKIVTAAQGVVAVFGIMRTAVMGVWGAITGTTGAVAILKAAMLALGKTPVLIILSLVVAAFGGTMLALADKIGELTGMGLDTAPERAAKRTPEAKAPGIDVTNQMADNEDKFFREQIGSKDDITSKNGPKGAAEAAKKAEKERIKASQDALKDYKKMLKYQQDNALVDIEQKMSTLDQQHKANPNSDEREYLTKSSQLDIDKIGIQLATQEQIKAKIEGAEFKEADDKQIELDNINLDIKKLKIALQNATENMDQLGKASVDSGEAIFAAAEKFLGVDYVMGGSGMSGTDCGKLTMDAYAAAGIELARRTADAQLAQMEDAGGFHNDKSKLKKGDLVFYDTKYMPVSDDRSALNANDQAYKANHVGLYQGNGKILHAGSSTGVAENIDMDFAKIVGFGDYTAIGGTAQQQRTKMVQEKSGKYADFIKSLLDEGDKILQEAAEAAGDVSGQQIAEINKQYNQTIEKFQNNHMPQKYIDAAEKVKAIKVGQINFTQTQQDLEYANNELVEFQGSLLNEMSKGSKDAAQATQVYISKFHALTDDKLKDLQSQLDQAMMHGNKDLIIDLRRKIKEVMDSIGIGIEAILKRIDDMMDDEIARVNANRNMTSRQKDDAIEAIRRQGAADKVSTLKEKVAELQAYSDDDKKTLKSNGFDVDAEIAAKQRQLELNEEYAKTPTLLDKIREASKQSFEDGILDFLERGILECKNLGEAFRNLAISVLQSIQKMYAEALMKNIMQDLFPTDSFALNSGKKLDSNFGYDMNNPFANILGFSEGGAIGADGAISGSGTPTSDNILAWVSPEEWIVKAESAKKVGANFMRALNSGDIYNLRVHLPKFANGGSVGGVGASAASQGMQSFSKNIGTSVSTKANVNVTVVRNEAEALAQTLGTREGANVMVNWVKGSGTLLSHIFDLSRRGR